MNLQQSVAPFVANDMRAAWPVRAWRCLRVAGHVLEGLATLSLVFPRLSSEARRRRIQRWSQRLLAMLGVQCAVRGIAPDSLPGNTMIVANHVSWLDIFAILSLHVVRFVGKAELGRWPLLGHLITGTGTILIDRSKRRDTGRINQTVGGVLAGGDYVAIFPEGTTTDGRQVLHFHGSLLQPVIAAGGHIAPVAFRYCNSLGELAESVVFVGETTFVQSFWWITGERRLTVEATFLPLMPARDGLHRRELARAAQNAIAGALGVPSEKGV